MSRMTRRAFVFTVGAVGAATSALGWPTLGQAKTSSGRVVVIGGGFGGKISTYMSPVAAILSKKAGHRPVKLIMDRAAVLAATGPNSGSHIHIKIGARKDGKITAAQTTLAYEAGAFPGSPVGAATGTILGSYNLDNVQIDGYDVVLNKPKVCDYRGSTTAIAASAAERVVDELCEKLGIDPLAFRALNGVKEGDYVRWNFFLDATVTVNGELWVEDGRLVRF